MEPKGSGALGLVGRPPSGPTDLPPSFGGLISGPTCHWHRERLLLCWFLALVGPQIHVMTCVVL